MTSTVLAILSSRPWVSEKRGRMVIGNSSSKTLSPLSQEGWTRTPQVSRLLATTLSNGGAVPLVGRTSVGR
ncbi:hypothetical protein JTE90_002281 [Oedothorax gibbosus]|uniref:Uncharacterized protein n=1 Tax=Oedothorax gibbosus TaxID=931172 RepID=A0AAV6UEM4_9ARAC|nr:hypothetical protein JTE90_002281 [Oedothorax gibbosus]